MDRVAADKFTEMVVTATSAEVAPRTRQLMESAIRHLHGFIEETGLTLDELVTICGFLVEAGKMSNDTRNEFLLTANILGLEVLVDMISPNGGPQTAVLGPMYLPSAPYLPTGASIVTGEAEGQVVFMEGYVRDAAGRPIAGATLDVWQAGADGLYDIQNPRQSGTNLRGVFTTDAEGYYAFHCLRPTAYPIPDDGPGGVLLRKLGRHPMRPAHLHLIVGAAGKHSIISQLYDRDCPYIDKDSIFAVKDSLVLDFEPAAGRGDAELYMRYDWTLYDA